MNEASLPRLNSIRILAIGAHPDDAEIGCGGLLSLPPVDGAILVLSHGETAREGDLKTRREESVKAAQILNAPIEFLGISGRKVMDDESTALKVVSHIRRVKPGYLVTHWRGDLHPDHQASYHLVRKAFYLCSKELPLDEDPWRCQNILYVHPFLSKYDFEADWVVDISDVYEKKIAAVRCHVSQKHLPLDHVDAISKYYGYLSGVERAEPFRSENPLIINRQLFCDEKRA